MVLFPVSVWCCENWHVVNFDRASGSRGIPPFDMLSDRRKPFSEHALTFPTSTVAAIRGSYQNINADQTILESLQEAMTQCYHRIRREWELHYLTLEINRCKESAAISFCWTPHPRQRKTPWRPKSVLPRPFPFKSNIDPFKGLVRLNLEIGQMMIHAIACEIQHVTFSSLFASGEQGGLLWRRRNA